MKPLRAKFEIAKEVEFFGVTLSAVLYMADLVEKRSKWRVPDEVISQWTTLIAERGLEKGLHEQFSGNFESLEPKKQDQKSTTSETNE